MQRPGYLLECFFKALYYVHYRKTDIGKPKATVAAAFVNKRVAGSNVTPYP